MTHWWKNVLRTGASLLFDAQSKLSRQFSRCPIKLWVNEFSRPYHQYLPVYDWMHMSNSHGIAYFTNSVKFICLIRASFRYQGPPHLATCCFSSDHWSLLAQEHDFASVMSTLNKSDSRCQLGSPIANFHQFLFSRLTRIAINKPSISSVLG